MDEHSTSFSLSRTDRKIVDRFHASLECLWSICYFTRERSAKTDDKYDFINSKGVTSAWNGDREDVPA